MLTEMYKAKDVPAYKRNRLAFTPVKRRHFDMGTTAWLIRSLVEVDDSSGHPVVATLHEPRRLLAK
jgi:hypothetical protein